MKSLPVALLLLAMASGAVAQSIPSEPPAAYPPAPGTDADDQEIVVEGEVPKEKRRVCEMRTGTGSIMPKRVCRTLAQIEEDARVARDSMERFNRDREARETIQANRDPGV